MKISHTVKTIFNSKSLMKPKPSYWTCVTKKTKQSEYLPWSAEATEGNAESQYEIQVTWEKIMSRSC